MEGAPGQVEEGDALTFLGDVQGNVLRGYKNHGHAVYLFCEIRDPELMRGWLDGRLPRPDGVAGEPERPELHAEEIVRLSDAWNQRTNRIVVAVREDEIRAERLAELRRALDLVPGSVPVSLELGLASGAAAVFDLPRHRVCVSESLVREIDGIFGRGATRCRVA